MKESSCAESASPSAPGNNRVTKPVISVGRFVNFVTVFILAFGLIFELPIFMIFLAKVKVFKRRFYEKNRRYALLLIAILSALLTPTPDIVNMSLMGGPLYLLYESGIIILRLLGIGNDESAETPLSTQ